MKKFGVIALLAIALCIALWQWPKPEAPLLAETENFSVVKQLPNNFFDEQVNPVLTQRCVVCHACYDAPCQLKISSSEGVARGASKEKVYEGTRITAAQPNRMFLDAHSTQAWRERGFFDVLPANKEAYEPKTQSSVLAQMLLLKKQHPLPNTSHLGSGFDISLSRENQCPTIDEMGEYIADQPLGGMPYALPGLSDAEHNTLMQWLHHGAPLSSSNVISEELNAEIVALEKWLNGDSNKMRLSARYIYEHLFTSHLYFKNVTAEKEQPQFFNLVRSRTPSGEPLDIIATRRPFDDPKVDRVYYRLQPVFSTIVSKTHQAYAINETLTNKWQAWFVDADYTVETLPSYESEVAANPLTAFTLLPVESRYRFMLERAQNTIMGYIKGPVCRGQVALNVINDRFWVFFVDPDIAASEEMNAFYASQKENLHLPAEKDSSALAVNWVKYAKRQGEYMRARTAFMNEEFKNGEHLNISSIWDGDGDNTNASLTVFRHFDNATVVKGMTGEPTKTAWVIDYALLERIHYLLVAGFDVYGNYGHQLMTRLYMDFLRMEGESNFLNLLPPETRHTLLKEWYQNASPELTDYLEGDINSFEQPSGIVFETENPQQELYQMLSTHLSNVLPSGTTYDKNILSEKQFSALASLDFLPAQQATLMPETTVIVIKNDEEPEKIDVFTALRNSAHYNVNSLFEEEENREPSKDTLTLVHGLLGSYPDAFWFIKASDITGSIEQLKSIKNEKDYKALLDKVGMRRTNPEFWTFSDNLLRWSEEQYPIEGGLLDYNRLEDR
ncbi:fatty acid cis/trans isomerase [Alteromonas gracilis]|uniref:9-hexadecenoic acid cis-trans isomerase n=1 Tax=Alteromonas gracilis TaxID=1479524 RepID=A0ABX5CLG0_9ALTE|nr:fatty acid cis/trans isomerase [Alteromonas gracilis]PRO68282.1 9-hexadecenoic acid cis-trans isomerase [Alteromonas gracilis]